VSHPAPCRLFGVVIAIGLVSGAVPGSAADEKKTPAAADRVAKAKQLLADMKTYPKGCSGFVSEVLGVPWASANDLMGDKPTAVDKVSDLKPGDIVGWKSATGSGHVAVYIGEGDTVFIDVHQEGEKPRKVKSYGAQKLYKSSRY